MSYSNSYIAALPKGFQLEDYVIDGILGCGGFGVTYRAHDRQLDAWVAIKEYFPVEFAERASDGITVRPNHQGSLPNSESGGIPFYDWGLDRFLNEARVLAQIRHQHVVRIVRYFSAHDTAYIAMEYEEGETLEAIIAREGPLAESDLRGMLLDILPALALVHDKGFLHRDIKPSNLYVRERDNSVMLIDFGAARAAFRRQVTGVTALISQGYSPPEQYGGELRQLGPWSDIYAVGATLYYCLVGKSPPEAALRLINDNLPQQLTGFRDRCSPAFLRAIYRALSLKPNDRFRSVDEFARTLGIALQEERSSAQLTQPQAAAPPAAAPQLSSFDAGAAKATMAQWDTAAMIKAEYILARFINTNAQPMVRDALKQARSMDEFYYLLSLQIDDDGQRMAFLTAVQGGGLALAASPEPPLSAATSSGNSALDAAKIERIKEALAFYIGPIAKVLVKKNLSQAASVADLCRLLGEHIASPEERHAFLRKMKSLE